MALIDGIADPEKLLKSFHSLKPSGNEFPLYANEYASIALELPKVIEETGQSLLTGNFCFGEPRFVDFKGKRPILVLNIKDRMVERSSYNCLAPLLKNVLAYEGVYGRVAADGEKKKSLRDLANRINELRSQYSYAFETDIKKFFPSISHDILVRQLADVLPDETANYILTQVLRRKPPEWPQKYERFFGNSECGIPQGSSLSPLLASIYLIPFDRKLESAHVKYVRYVDDLIVFCNSKKEAEEAESLVHESLGALKLEADKSYIEEDRKAKILDSDMPISFVGFDFVPPNLIQPRAEAINNFKDRITEIAAQAPNLRTLLTQISNFVEGWLAAYDFCDIQPRLNKELDEHQLQVVRKWLKSKGVLARSYHNYPKRSQAIDLGLTLLNIKRKNLDAIDLTNDNDWYENALDTENNL